MSYYLVQVYADNVQVNSNIIALQDDFVLTFEGRFPANVCRFKLFDVVKNNIIEFDYFKVLQLFASNQLMTFRDNDNGKREIGVVSDRYKFLSHIVAYEDSTLALQIFFKIFNSIELIENNKVCVTAEFEDFYGGTEYVSTYFFIDCDYNIFKRLLYKYYLLNL